MLPLGVAALLTLGATVLVRPVSAKLTLDAKPAKAGVLPETGGQRVRLPRPFRPEYGQFGRMTVTCQGAERLGMTPSLGGWLPVQRFGWGGQMMPFGDGAFTCMVLP
jgi:hypothetical protein